MRCINTIKKLYTVCVTYMFENNKNVYTNNNEDAERNTMSIEHGV